MMHKLSLDQTAAKYPNNIAILTADESVSYKQLSEHVQSVTLRLQEKNFAAGDHIGIVTENSIDTIVTLYALWQIGAVACLLNRRWPQSMLNDAISNIGCTSIDVINGAQHDQEISQPQIYDNNRHATIIFTSGSSAKPKGVVHTFGNHLYSALGSHENISFTSNDRWLLSLPLCHVGGLSILFRTLLAGAAVVIGDVKNTINETIEKHNVTHCSLVPTQLRRMIDNVNSNSLTSLKTVLVGGASVPDDLIKEVIQIGLPIFVTYGMTEMASQVTTTLPTMSIDDTDNSGRLLPHRELKIDHNNEILVRGKTLSVGYITNGTIQPLVDSDGWYHTGDIGKLDSEQMLYVHGRLDNMFISGGENIQPEQIEKILISYAEITQALVVPVKNDEFGNRPVAFIEMSDNKKVAELNLSEKLRQSLPGYMIPIKFLDWPEDLQDHNMKVNRKKFAQFAQERIDKISK